MDLAASTNQLTQDTGVPVWIILLFVVVIILIAKK